MSISINGEKTARSYWRAEGWLQDFSQLIDCATRCFAKMQLNRSLNTERRSKATESKQIPRNNEACLALLTIPKREKNYKQSASLTFIRQASMPAQLAATGRWRVASAASGRKATTKSATYCCFSARAIPSALRSTALRPAFVLPPRRWVLFRAVRATLAI